MLLSSRAVTGVLVAAATAMTASAQFRPVASFGVPGGVAEIVAASPDGMTLVYSDAGSSSFGVVNITNPASPAIADSVALTGEPTSVAIRGNLALGPVWEGKPEEGQPPPPFDPSIIAVMDISTPSATTLVGTIDIGYHPDSIALTRIRNRLVAVVAIENEPVVVENGVVTGDDEPGDPNDISPAGFVQVIVVDTANPANSTVTDVALPMSALSAAGCLFADDPQPEYVSIFGTTAAVSLQENNGIAIIDIADPTNPSLVRVFSLGTASERLADIYEDDMILFADGYPSMAPPVVDAGGNPVPAGARMPDAIAFSPNGSVIYSMDEGEFNYTGGRGFSAWDVNGNRVWDDGGSLERIAVRFGHYPEGRSENKGSELEGVATARFGRTSYAFVLSERGSSMSVYDVTNPRRPRFRQMLPTGLSPEGVVPIPSRDLVITADEESGTLSIFEAGAYPADPNSPRIRSADGLPWAAISGVALDGGDSFLWAVPDNAVPTEIYRVGLGGAMAPINVHICVQRNGVQARYDGEGIAVDTSDIAPAPAATPTGPQRGWWIASEGNGSSRPNLLVQIDGAGDVVREIQLPSNVDAAADPSIGGSAQGAAGGQMIRGNGFEGVTISSDGRYLLACIQRDFANEFPTGDRFARIARYDTWQIQNGTAPNSGLRTGGDWDFFFVRLDSNDPDNWAGLSDITTVGPNEFAIIERDKGIGLGSALKKIYAFSLTGVAADADGLPDSSDTVTKVELADVLADFFPYEKIEGLALTANGEFWISMDNDGGELESRVSKIAPRAITTTDAAFGSSCNTLALSAAVTTIAPVRNIVDLTITGYAAGAAGTLFVAPTSNVTPLPAPFNCDLLDATSSIPLSLNPGSTTVSFEMPLASGFTANVQAISAILAGTVSDFDTSNGITLTNSY